jgi:glycosyltransferase involved in cell wall biosynthesis
MKLFIFEAHPVQYHAPVYRTLHRICKERASGQIHVFYATDITLRGHYDKGFGKKVAWDEPLLQGYPVAVLNNEKGTPLDGFNSLTGSGILSLLKRQRPDAILLTGLAYRFDWTAYFSALRLRIPLWIRTETQDQAFARSWAKSLVRSWFYRLAYAPINKALVIGRLNGAHYDAHGLSAEQHVRSPYCVVDRFERLTEQEAKASRHRVRTESGFGSGIQVLLFCGKLLPKKYPDALLEAMQRMRPEERQRFGIVYVGSGELETKLRSKAETLGNVKVHFAGFKNQTELAPYYLASDVLVLPSRQMGETWGLVVNEALHAGRRVIVSRFAGCHADFVDAPGVTVFDGSVAGLVEALRPLPPLPLAGAQAEFMRQYSIRAAAEGIATAMGLSNPVNPPQLNGVARIGSESLPANDPLSRMQDASSPPGLVTAGQSDKSRAK